KELNQKIRKLKQHGQQKSPYLFNQLLQAATQLNKELEQDYPLYQQVKIKQPFLRTEKLQQALADESSALINYFLMEESIVFLFVNPDTVIFHRGEWGEDEQTQLRWFKGFLAGKHDPFKEKNIIRYQQLGHQFYQKLIAPIDTHLSPAQELIIIPQDQLHSLAFDALLYKPITNQGTAFNRYPYLIQQQTITYNFSARTWLHQQPNNQTFNSPSILAYAFSKNGTPIAELRSQAKAAIPGTALELKAIDKAFPKADKTLRFGAEEAKLEHFLKAIEEPYDIFHFALHADSDQSNRLNNIIYFPGNPVDSIYGYELIARQLKGRLAVLASCKTATGTVESGEGLYSLSRAFLLAGVEGVVSSHWEIDDRSTSELIDFFYQQLKQQKSTPNALRQAKLEYIKAQSKFDAHPYYWSGLGYWGE
ncbi:MAG: CHAT domain-containing protein, partial [Bacteroidota bacterium]